jgi:hypothetical protein
MNADQIMKHCPRTRTAAAAFGYVYTVSRVALENLVAGVGSVSYLDGKSRGGCRLSQFSSGGGTLDDLQGSQQVAGGEGGASPLKSEWAFRKATLQMTCRESMKEGGKNFYIAHLLYVYLVVFLFSLVQ